MMLEYIYAKTSVKALITDEEIAQRKISLGLVGKKMM